MISLRAHQSIFPPARLTPFAKLTLPFPVQTQPVPQQMYLDRRLCHLFRKVRYLLVSSAGPRLMPSLQPGHIQLPRLAPDSPCLAARGPECRSAQAAGSGRAQDGLRVQPKWQGKEGSQYVELSVDWSVAVADPALQSSSRPSTSPSRSTPVTCVRRSSARSSPTCTKPMDGKSSVSTTSAIGASSLVSWRWVSRGLVQRKSWRRMLSSICMM